MEMVVGFDVLKPLEQQISLHISSNRIMSKYRLIALMKDRVVSLQAVSPSYMYTIIRPTRAEIAAPIFIRKLCTVFISMANHTLSIYAICLLLYFIKCVLRMKATTCTTIVYGECGRLPLSVFCYINVLCFAYSLLTLPAHTLAKSVYSESERLHHQGFETWVSKVHEMGHTYGVRMSGNTVEFKMHCQSQVKEHFINEWHDGLSAPGRPLLRTHRLFKSSFGPESYLFNVKDQRYRTAITKLRASSHI